MESLSHETTTLPGHSDYEYEYDETETETFYVNLDLTACNGPLRPPRRRSAASTSDFPESADTQGSQPGSPVSRDPAMDVEPDVDTQLQSQIQIMELHSPNPIVSYQNQIFRCSWADSVGTDMMFSLPELDPLEDRDFDLIASTRFKILGQKAHLISGSGASQAQRLRSRGIASGQAQFLECLTRSKRAKGEEDAVRTVFPQAQKRSQVFEEKLQGWARTEGMLAELERLNLLAREGDLDAVRRLEEIYLQFDAASRSSIDYF